MDSAPSHRTARGSRSGGLRGRTMLGALSALALAASAVVTTPRDPTVRAPHAASQAGPPAPRAAVRTAAQSAEERAAVAAAVAFADAQAREEEAIQERIDRAQARERARAQARDRAARATDPEMAAVGWIVADLPYDPVANGWRIAVGDHPEAPGHWGVTDPLSREIYIGADAFASADRLAMVVAHEAAHARHFDDPSLAPVLAEMPEWLDAQEAFADCQAILWGASDATTHYWRCPAPYRDIVAAHPYE